MAVHGSTKDVSPLMAVLRERWVMTLATLPLPDPSDREAKVPYPTPLFYAVLAADLPSGPQLVFASDPDSTHGRHLGTGPTAVAAGLYLESERVDELRGVQLRGGVVRASVTAAATAAARAAYLGRHPTAAGLLGPGARVQLYVLAVIWAKLTDNRLGFGHKLEWRFPGPGLFTGV